VSQLLQVTDELQPSNLIDFDLNDAFDTSTSLVGGASMSTTSDLKYDWVSV
jgi:hypothetical protein